MDSLAVGHWGRFASRTESLSRGLASTCTPERHKDNAPSLSSGTAPGGDTKHKSESIWHASLHNNTVVTWCRQTANRSATHLKQNHTDTVIFYFIFLTLYYPRGENPSQQPHQVVPSMFLSMILYFSMSVSAAQTYKTSKEFSQFWLLFGKWSSSETYLIYTRKPWL